jgi:acetyl-CoA C-acetyltransferase
LRCKKVIRQPQTAKRTMKQSPETTPVILAVGEVSHKVNDLAEAQEPVALMARAMRAAEDDAGADILGALDAVQVLGVVSWLYRNPAAQLCDALAINPPRQVKAGMGGEKPIRLIHDAALSIQSGDAQAIAIVGGEAQNAFRKARRSKTRLNWTPRATKEEAWDDIEDTTLGVRETARALGVQWAPQIYPFFENALSHSLGQSPTEAVRSAAHIWAAYAAESVSNPHAWSQVPYDARDIATISKDNRMVAFPYPKLMVANDSVNQAAAVIVTSLAFAKAAGVDEERLVFFHGGAAAKEPDDFLLRARFNQCPAMEAVLCAASREAGGAEAFDLAEIYSCFPVVPKLALKVLREEGLKSALAPTVAGGLTFFGGPMNNYMTHAVAAMVRRLRARKGAVGLLYGQGGAMTKHHALACSTTPPDRPLADDYSVQEDADALRGDAPAVVDRYSGPAVVETYSAYYGPDGEPALGAVVLRTPDGARTIAAASANDEDTIALLTDFDRSAIGVAGVVRDQNGRMTWSIE